MSSITLYADLLFDDLAQVQHLEQFLLAQNEDVPGDRDPYWMPVREARYENLSDILNKEDCDIEEVERAESCLSVVLTGGTLQFPEKALVSALDNLGAVAATIEIIDDQVGEERCLGRRQGKRCGFSKARRLIDEANPVCGAVRAIKDESDRRFLSLLKQGNLDPNARWRRQSLLSYACKYGLGKSALALIDAGADCSAADGRHEIMEWSGRTPLHFAALHERTERQLVDALLNGGADVEASDSEGTRPLHLAVRYGNGTVVSALLAAGADANARGIAGFTPLLCLADAGRDDTATILEMLVLAGARLDATCDHGGNVLWYANDPDLSGRARAVGLNLQRPSHAYSNDACSNLVEALSHRDLEMLPRLVAKAGRDDRLKLISKYSYMVLIPEIFSGFLQCDIDDVVEELAKKLLKDLGFAGSDAQREQTRKMIERMREKWPERLAEFRLK